MEPTAYMIWLIAALVLIGFGWKSEKRHQQNKSWRNDE